MKFRFLNKTIENQKFRYTPLYYNERTERLNRKKEQFQKTGKEDISDLHRKERFRDSLQEGWSRAEYRQSQNRSSNIRIIVLILLIVGLGYFIFNGVNEVDTVVKKLW